MTSRKVFCVGLSIPSDDVVYVPLDSDQSLLDADVVVFQPGIPSSYYGYEKDYRGKPTLSQSGSFKIVEQSSHWGAELKAAVDHGKTVIVFLAKPEEAYAYTGRQETSGTGRNQKVTNIVDLVSSYDALPLKLGNIVPRKGREIIMASNVGPIAPYWSEFREVSPFQVYLEGAPGEAVLLTKTGSMTIGCLIKSGKGHVVLLPPVQLDDEKFSTTDDDGIEYWSEEGLAFGAQLVDALLRLDRELRGEGGRTPPPEWATNDRYRLTRENELQAELISVTREIEALRTRRESLSAEMDSESRLRRLLFASGSELEEAVLDALRLLEYHAENLAEGESEFDAVMVSPEGERYIGEAEGKENKAVNIDKLGQLERNIQEDFARDEVQEPARGILFGNAFRLQDPTSRAEFFTDKCQSGARRSGIVLVRTTDLFEVAKHLKEKPDPMFAKDCRQAIAGAQGSIVRFPVIPANG